MKKLLVLVVLLILFSSISIQAKGLNSNSIYIKKHYPDAYEKIFKAEAIKKWKDDYRMIVYEINQQVDALVSLVNEFESENTNIAFKAISKWSTPGYRKYNIKIWKKINTFNLKQLVVLRCDWTMVKYTYNKQVEAKNAF